MYKERIVLGITGFEGGVSSCILAMKGDCGAEVMAANFDFKEVAGALFNNVVNFQTEHWGGDDDKFDGIIYRPGGEDTEVTAIPENILTEDIVKKLEEFLVNAENRDKAIEIATAFNTLFKDPLIQQNFAALVGENITAAKLAAMAAKHNEIETALAANGADNAAEIAQVIAKLNFTDANIDAILTELAKPQVNGNIHDAIDNAAAAADDDADAAAADAAEAIATAYNNLVAAVADDAVAPLDTVEHAVAVVDRLLNGHDNIKANFAALTDGVDAAKLAAMADKAEGINTALTAAGDAA